MMHLTRLVLIRHAEPDEKVHGRCYGALDIGLSWSGRRQARLLARKLSHLSVAAVYSSPLKRAVETAAPIAAAHGLAPTVYQHLREVDFGAFEGRSYAEIEQGNPDVYRQWMETPTLVQFPSGDSYAKLSARAVTAMEAIRDVHSDATVVVVSHGGVLRAMLASCLSIPNDAVFRLQQSYGSTSIVDWIDRTPLVRLVNGQAEMLANNNFLRLFTTDVVRETEV